MIGLKFWRKFQPLRRKTNDSGMLNAAGRFLPRRALSKLQVQYTVIVRNFDRFLALFSYAVIGWNNYFGIGFSTVIWKPLHGTEIIEFTIHSHKNARSAGYVTRVQIQDSASTRWQYDPAGVRWINLGDLIGLF